MKPKKYISSLLEGNYKAVFSQRWVLLSITLLKTCHLSADPKRFEHDGVIYYNMSFYYDRIS